MIDRTAHYPRRASSGDKRDAFQAGYAPAPMLNSTERIQTLRRSFEMNIGEM